MNEYCSIGQAAKQLGLSITTLRRWEQQQKLIPAFRTFGNHRRYKLLDIIKLNQQKTDDIDDRKTIAYARVSTSKQKKNLTTQVNTLEQYCDNNNIEHVEIIKDLGSGLNYKKRGLNKVIDLITSYQIKHLILNYKDRLLRFGSEIIFKLCDKFNVTITIVEHKKEKSREQAFCEDLCEIMSVFSAKLYGSRSLKKRTKKT